MRKNKKMIEELQNPTVETVDTIDEVTEDDNFLFPDDESESNGDLNLDGVLDSDDDGVDDDDFDSDDDVFGDDDLDSDDDEFDDDDLDSDDDEADDDDLDSDDDALDPDDDVFGDDDLDSDDDEADDDDDDDIFSDTAELENDPFAFVVELRQAALPTNKKMLMTVKEIDYKNISAEESQFGKAAQTFSITCDVEHPTTKEVVTIKEFGSNTNNRFIKIVTALNNGTIPNSLSKIIGKKAIVTITHNTDKLGNVWDNINTIEPYNPSSKKKAK